MTEDFILRAKAACYVGGGVSDQPSRLGSHDLTYAKNALFYRDSYFGGADFLGQEVVWQDGRPAWVMNYYGRILRDDLLTAAQGGAVIKAALSALYREGRFLGGFSFSHDGFDYSDHSDGPWTCFTGFETISRSNSLAYRLDYHGGLVRD